MADLEEEETPQSAFLRILDNFQDAQSFELEINEEGDYPPSPALFLKERFSILKIRKNKFTIGHDQVEHTFEFPFKGGRRDSISGYKLLKLVCAVYKPESIGVRFTHSASRRWQYEQEERAPSPLPDGQCGSFVHLAIFNALPSIMTSLNLTFQNLTVSIKDFWGMDSQIRRLSPLLRKDIISDTVRLFTKSIAERVDADIAAWRDRGSHRSLEMHLNVDIGDMSPFSRHLEPDELFLSIESKSSNLQPAFDALTKPLRALTLHLDEWKYDEMSDDHRDSILKRPAVSVIDITNAVNDSTIVNTQLPMRIGRPIAELVLPHDGTRRNLPWRVEGTIGRLRLQGQTHKLTLADRQLIQSAQPWYLELSPGAIRDKEPYRDIYTINGDHLVDDTRNAGPLGPYPSVKVCEISCHYGKLDLLLQCRRIVPEACWIGFAHLHKSVMCHYVSFGIRQPLLSDVTYLWRERSTRRFIDAMLLLLQACTCAHINVPDAVAAALLKAAPLMVR